MIKTANYASADVDSLSLKSAGECEYKCRNSDNWAKRKWQPISVLSIFLGDSSLER